MGLGIMVALFIVQIILTSIAGCFWVMSGRNLLTTACLIICVNNVIICGSSVIKKHNELFQSNTAIELIEQK